MLPRLQFLNFEYSAAVIQELAKFHAASVLQWNGDGHALLKSYPWLQESQWRSPVSPLWIQFVQNTFEAIPTFLELKGFSKESKIMRETFDLVTLLPKMNKLTQIPQNWLSVINHGDLWTNNILFKDWDHTNGKWDNIDLKFVDYQLSKVGSRILDLSYIIFTSVEGDLIVFRLNDLLRVYFDCFQESVKAHKMPGIRHQSWADFESEWNEYQFFGLTLASLYAPPMFVSLENVPDLENLSQDDIEGPGNKSGFSTFIDSPITLSRLRKKSLQYFAFWSNMGMPWVQTLSRDLRFAYRFAKAAKILSQQRRLNRTVGETFDALANKIPEKTCFICNDEIWTYRRVQEESNRIGNYFSNQGFTNGDVVSILMTNRMEVATTWLGLSKIGVIGALVNSTLRSKVLKHSIEIVQPNAIICGYELSEELGNIYDHGSAHVPVFGSGQVGDRGVLSRATDLDKALPGCSVLPPIPKRPVRIDDDLIYLYTSGTTGLPKAAIIKNSRFSMVAECFAAFVATRNSDVLYSCFPIQHTATGVIGVGFPMLNGIPLVLRTKFSASKFWSDCIKYNVTVVQYLGEICRYLLKSPITPEETQHSLRMFFGTGLKLEYWNEFKTRFKIPLIVEMYASTEGNCSLLNIFGEPPGSCGFVPPIVQSNYPVQLIKLDENDEPIRNPSTGLVVQPNVGEPGEVVGRIVKGNAIREYQGYVKDESGTQKKILGDVLTKGDTFFRSGDILMRDKFGAYFFQDRIGDTFRFKSENVSTNQVEGVINSMTHAHDVVVFGVKIPGVEGSVGMGVIADPLNELNLQTLADGLFKELPNYCIPRFLRIVDKIEDTHTHKLKKLDLKKDGYDLNKIKTGKIYVLIGKEFQILTPQLVTEITCGRLQV